ncbi:MAG: CvpA family protein [Bacilli bacterium]|jgi:uncharacterized membrane protein required for colicin V production|nr:CvpA family protein [Bacilli bacterium]
MEFQFGYIIIIVVLLSILYGSIRGFFLQLRAVLSLGIPMVVAGLLKETILGLVGGVPIFDQAAGFILNIFRFFTNITLDQIKNDMIVFVLLILSFVLVRAVFSIFGPSKFKKIVKEKSKASKWVGAALGLAQGYLLSGLIYMLVASMLPIDTTQAITSVWVGLLTPFYAIMGL